MPFNYRNIRPFSLADHKCCLVLSLGGLKARSTTETVVESRVAKTEICEKLLPISNNGPNKQSSGEISTDQDGLWQNNDVFTVMMIAPG